jgi:hypothetical protein
VVSGWLLVRYAAAKVPTTGVCIRVNDAVQLILNGTANGLRMCVWYAGGWFTYTTLSAMNDALYAMGMKVAYRGQPAAGSWSVTDDQARVRAYEDDMVIPASRPEHRNRGQIVLTAYAGGAEVPVYAARAQAASTAQRQPAAASARPPAAAGAAAAAVSRGPPTAAGGCRVISTAQGYGWLGCLTLLQLQVFACTHVELRSNACSGSCNHLGPASSLCAVLQPSNSALCC